MDNGESELLRRAVGGDADAFLAIWDAHRSAVYAFACWMLQDAGASEDVAQECFLALLEHPGRFDASRGSLRTFLLAIARNRRRRIWRNFLPEVSLDQVEADCEMPVQDLVESAESQAILIAAVLKLPPLQREALFLFEYEELSLNEAAAVAGVDVATFKSRLNRSRKRLRRELAWLVKEGF